MCGTDAVHQCHTPERMERQEFNPPPDSFGGGGGKNGKRKRRKRRKRKTPPFPVGGGVGLARQLLKSGCSAKGVGGTHDHASRLPLFFYPHFFVNIHQIKNRRMLQPDRPAADTLPPSPFRS